jgi:hypothetical protein
MVEVNEEEGEFAQRRVVVGLISKEQVKDHGQLTSITEAR